ncbi:MAG: restriction endonuclease subunit S [Bacteroidales bacterium]|nr:restriction endonuclease subunit S [Bacteroidales bacterium]
MKEGWTYKKLGELFPIVMGKTPPRNVSRYWDEKKETNNLWVSIADLSKYEGKEIHETKEHISDEGKQGIKQIPKGSLLVSFKLTLGKMAFAGEKLYTNEAIMSLQRRDDVDLVFLYYYFSFLDWNKIASGNEKVKGKTLNKKSLSEILVAYIPLKDQHSIVARLDAAFAHIDALKANAEKQLAEARQLFQAELTECMRPKEGWEEKTLPDISENLDSIRIPVTKKNRTEGKYPYYGASGIVDYVDDYLFDEDLLCISEDGANLLMRTYPIAFPISGKVWVNNHAHVLRFKSLITQKYVEYYFSGLKLDEYITGAAQPKLTQKALNSIIINIPQKIDIQRSIVSRLDALSANIKKLEEVQRKTLAECDALKQAMLREVFE